MYFSFCTMMYGSKFLCPIVDDQQLKDLKKQLILQEDEENDMESESSESQDGE